MAKRTEKEKQAYKDGFARGASIASWQDLPVPGETYWTDGNGKVRVESESHAEDVFMDACSSAEDNDRQYSPFEFTAHEFNEDEDCEDLWEAFQDGINDGIAKSWEDRAKEYKGVDWDAIEAGQEGWDASSEDEDESEDA